jgi:hypothetical protein
MEKFTLEQHLIELGLSPAKKPEANNPPPPNKIPFNDPRDPVTKEVPF